MIEAFLIRYFTIFLLDDFDFAVTAGLSSLMSSALASASLALFFESSHASLARMARSQN